MARVLNAQARRGLVLALVLCAGASGAPHAADAGKGADVFDENCSECHSVAKTLRNKKGPSLYQIVGRPAAQIDGFNYSDAIKARPLMWTRENLDLYITRPKQFIAGGKMKFDGLDDAAERADLIEFLARAP